MSSPLGAPSLVNVMSQSELTTLLLNIFSDFLKGFCPAGSDCKKKHFFEKSPEKVSSHPQIESEEVVRMREKKIAPAKPKRKSLCATPMSEKKARVRYYDESQHEPDKTGKIRFEQDQTEIGDRSELTGDVSFSPSLEEKRKRLLRKVELAKQVKMDPNAKFMPRFKVVCLCFFFTNCPS